MSMSMEIIKLTKRQTEVFEFIQSEITTKHRAPTRAEIAEHFDFKSANAAADHVNALIRKGMLIRTPGISRGLNINEKAVKVAA